MFGFYRTWLSPRSLAQRLIGTVAYLPLYGSLTFGYWFWEIWQTSGEIVSKLVHLLTALERISWQSGFPVAYVANWELDKR